MTPTPDHPTILIIDDVPSNLGVVVDLFESQGYRVAIAQDGEEGMQRARLVHPELILLDVMMPGADGFEICHWLKEDQSTRDIPVIFMTALASAEHKVKGFRAGAVDYVTKPLQIDEVMARVDTHLKLHAAQKELAGQNEELERRVAERTAELAAREREFRTLAENLPDNLVRYDRESRITYMNRNLESVLGKKLDEARGKTPLDSSQSQFYDEFQARLNETIATGQPREVELVMPDGGEGVRYHHIRFVAERDAAGEIVGALAIGRDITERKKTERELFLLNSAVNASSEAAFLMDAQGRFVYVNEEACRSLGLSRDELLGMSPLDIDPDITPETFKGMLEATLSGEPGKTPIESHHRSRDGRVFPVEIAASPLTLDGKSYHLTMVRDISARKEAERILHEQQQAIRAVVENSPDAHARYDRQFRRVYVNPAAQRLLGLPLEEILGKTPVTGEVLPPEFTKMLESVFQRGAEMRTELPFRWPNGEKGWGDVRIVPEFGPDGSVVTVLSIGRDITERKRAEDLLREERGLFVGGPTVVFKWRAEEGWPVEYVSPNVLEQFGYAAYELTSGTMPFSSIVHPDDLARVGWEVNSYTAAGRSSYEQEYRIVHANGSYRWIYDFTIVSRREDGTVDQYLGYVMDITDRKNAENALKESEQRYRMVFENSPVSLWEEDFSAVKTLFDDLRRAGVSDLEAHFDRHPVILGQCANLAKIVNVNLAAVALHEAADKEALFAGILNTFTAESFDAFRRELVGLWNGKTAMNTDAVVKTLAGERRDVNVHFSVCPGHEDTFSRVLVSLVDITERKRAERELIESRAQLRGLTAQREAAREEERKYIAREVHDELGQILTGLKLNVSVLDHKLAVKQELTREQLQETMQLTDRALNVARNVASALRPSALEMGIVSALEWLAGRFDSNTGIRCEVHIENDEIQVDEACAIALYRIVQESLTNVARYAKAERVDVSLSREADDYVLKVRDNGVGFDVRRKMTDSFGLVGIRERALLLGGTVNIESQPGKGTEIAVRIPIQTVAEES